MKTLNKTILMCFVALTSIICFVTKAEVVDVYDFKMTLKIPRVYNNTKSLGYRKYQTQLIKGYLLLSYSDNISSPKISIVNLYNKTHKINNQNITYDCDVDNDGDYFYPRISYIGNNSNNKFKTPNMCFYLIAEPSYNIAEHVDEDNSLYIMLSGIGKSTEIQRNTQIIKKINGKVTGILGCGCKAYGHISPTRTVYVNGPGDVTDVACVYGTWYAVWKKKMSRDHFYIYSK